MTDYAASRPSTSLAILLDWATERGVTPRQCLAGTGIAPWEVRNPTTQISGLAEMTAIANILGCIGDAPALGLSAAARYPVTSYGVWGLAILTSSTLGDAIDVAVRFARLGYGFSGFDSTIGDDRLSIHVDASTVPRTLRRFILERDTAAIPNLCREVLHIAPAPIRIEFDLPHPGRYADAYDVFFGNPAHFDCASTAVTFSREHLSTPLIQASPHTAKRARGDCEALIRTLDSRMGRAGVVRGLLRMNPSRPPDVAAVAERLSCSTRTLRRQLESEGTSFRALLGEVRRQLGEELLAGGVSVEQVSSRLGYTDVSNFSHAFRRWTGESPRTYINRVGRRSSRI